MNKIKLTYFDIDGGRAEPVRIAMSIGNIEFEDDRISFAEFGVMRGGTPLNAVPIVEIDGVVYTQSDAMCRYFGKLAGLYPADPWRAFLCDEVIDTVDDALVATIRTFGLEDESLKAAREDLAGGTFTRCLKLLESRLDAEGGDYFSGDALTIADIKTFVWTRSLASGILDHIPTGLVASVAPRLEDHRERIAAEPGVVAYYKKRLT
jgi:glutathione S-transferase